MSTTLAQKRAVEKYDKGNTRQIHLKLNLSTDKDILQKLKQVDGIQTYIKELIRRDIQGK